jgi:hypothetical protein
MEGDMTDDDLIRHLLDLATESLDYGSGFMDNDDVETLRAAAVRVGVDPWTVTPDNHKPNYCPGHEWSEWQEAGFSYFITWSKEYRRCAVCEKTEYSKPEPPPGASATHSMIPMTASPGYLAYPQVVVDTPDDEVV